MLLQGNGSKELQFRVYKSISVLLTVRFSSVGLAVDALEQEMAPSASYNAIYCIKLKIDS